MIYGDLHILYQDNELAVVEKPGGLLSVPGRGPDKQDCVVNRLRKLIPAAISQPAVHRLDMATSGLMVLAITKEAHRILSGQFAKQQVKKKYIALVDGLIEKEEGQIELAFRLDPDNRPHQIYDPIHGKKGHTHWRLIGRKNKNSRLEFTPSTGRTHQLRLHASHALGLNTPIIGDPLYGNSKRGEQLMLHATFLSFAHPSSGKILQFSSEPPF